MPTNTKIVIFHAEINLRDVLADGSKYYRYIKPSSQLKEYVK